MTRVGINVGVVPEVGRPEAVTNALAEAVALHAKGREAADALAAAQAALEQVQADDVARAAQRVREGGQTGAVPVSVTKARDRVELAKREVAAIRLAVEGAEEDLG